MLLVSSCWQQGMAKGKCIAAETMYLECEGKIQMALVSQADMGPDLKDALAEVSTVKVHACLTYRSLEMFEDCLARKIALMGEFFQEDINQIRQLGQGYARGEQAFWRGELADDAGVDELRDAMKRVSKSQRLMAPFFARCAILSWRLGHA